MSEPLSISAIVPTLDEEPGIAACLERLRAIGVAELIVVDGGSADRTVEIAAGLADRLLVERGGLFAQLNRGAAAARGEVLLFHHADGKLAPGALAAIRAALAEPAVAGGAFRLAFASRGAFYRWVALFAHWRNRLGLGPFGDQSLFVRAEAFRRLGGFAVGDALADHALVRTLKRSARFRLLDEPVVTSVRRWERRGRLRTLLGHWKVCALYLLGARRVARAADRQLESMRRVR